MPGLKPLPLDAEFVGLKPPRLIPNYSIPNYSTTRTRWGTLATMPRMDGVSSRSTIWLRRVKPRPLTTSLCLTGVQILERKYCSLILAVAFLVAIGLELLGNLLSEELELFDCFAAQGGDFGLVAKLDESVEGGLDDVVRVRGAEALGEHVLHAGGGHDGTDGLAGDDACTFGGRLE